MDCKNVNIICRTCSGIFVSSVWPADVKSILLIVFLVSGFVVDGAAQRQFIVLKNEEVLARYQKGDIIKFMRAQDKEMQVQRILDLNDTLLMMNFDSVAYYRIQKLDIRDRKSSSFGHRLGRYMIMAGVLLPVIELLNTGVFQDTDREATVSSEVLIVSGVLVGTGAVLAFVNKPYFKPGRKHHMFIINEQSPFYKEKNVQLPDIQVLPKN
jgi:hypothetical protein